MLNSEENLRVLVNTFDALEFDALKILKHVTMIGIGPSIPSVFLKDNIFRADMIEISSKNYMGWLNLKDKGSVIYIAFGSHSEISSQLLEEIGQGLLKCGRPFLWVIREGKDGYKIEEQLSGKDKLEMQGKMVSWCSQVEVLKHPSVGCFLTHCGWNSTLESIASGLPIVACPIWNDQVCNTKFIQDIWKNGVILNVSEGGVVERYEFSRCIEIVMGGSKEGKEMRRNAKKWSDLAKEAMK
nr:crocetin glucosyltransferase, chloroplastic-like [Solanum lycopersicum]